MVSLLRSHRRPTSHATSVPSDTHASQSALALDGKDIMSIESLFDDCIQTAYTVLKTFHDRPGPLQCAFCWGPLGTSVIMRSGAAVCQPCSQKELPIGLTWFDSHGDHVAVPPLSMCSSSLILRRAADAMTPPDVQQALELRQRVSHTSASDNMTHQCNRATVPANVENSCRRCGFMLPRSSSARTSTPFIAISARLL